MIDPVKQPTFSRLSGPLEPWLTHDGFDCVSSPLLLPIAEKSLAVAGGRVFERDPVAGRGSAPGTLGSLAARRCGQNGCIVAADDPHTTVGAVVVDLS